MKNYPLLTVNNQNRFYQWQNKVIIPLLNQIKDLSYYSYFMIPPYRYINTDPYRPVQAYIIDQDIDRVVYYNSLTKEEITPTIRNQNDFLMKQQQLWDDDQAQIVSSSAAVVQEWDMDVFDYKKMPVHSYYQVIEPITIENLSIPSGSYIVSNARAEQMQDTDEDSIRSNFEKYYTYQPGGIGSFYVLTNIRSNPQDWSDFTLIFTYLRNAGEVFGLEPPFNFLLSNNRFITNAEQLVASDGITVNSNDLGALVGDIFVQWYTLGNPMHFTYVKNSYNNTNNYEEVIMDDTYKIKLAYGNTHNYTINTKNGNNPNQLYIDFI